MKASLITTIMWLALAATAVGQAKSSGSAPSAAAPSKASLSEVRAVVHELEGRTEKLRELLSNHRSLVDQQPEGGPQLAKWEAALERLMTRIEGAHAAIIETTQRLDKAVTGELPTGLAKDVARARNEAEPERVMAQQILAKRKPAATRKPAKQAAASEKPNHEDYDL